MTAYVVDASTFDAVVPLIEQAESIFAPELIDLEVANALRKSILRGHRTSVEASEAFIDWTKNDVQRLSHGGQLDTVWALRHNITPYDAVYVALAMHLDVALVTSDRRLAAAAAPYCQVVTID